MSCRAIGRRAETMFLNVILEELRNAGYTVLRGEYFPSPRNRSSDVLARAWFSRNWQRQRPGGRCFERDLAVKPCPAWTASIDLTILDAHCVSEDRIN